MENYWFMRKLLGWLAVPFNFNRMVAIALRVFATLLVPMSLVTFFKVGKSLFDLPANAVLGGILFQMFYAVAIYAVVHTLFIRARDIDDLPAGDYSMFPLAAVLIKGCSEAMAAFVAFVAAGGGIYVWFTGKGIASVLTPPPKFLPVYGDTSFMGGIEFMVGGLFSAIAIVAGGYLVASLLNLLYEVAARQRARPETVLTTNLPPSVSDMGYKLRSGTGS